MIEILLGTRGQFNKFTPTFMHYHSFSSLFAFSLFIDNSSFSLSFVCYRRTSSLLIVELSMRRFYRIRFFLTFVSHVSKNTGK